MRTLKKTLSLVLVVAMVLGLCVVGASAKDAVENFTDDYQKVGAAYQEAMGVLVGVGIIDGMTETALEPQGTYTREQAAKIIAYMLLGKSKADSLKCTVAPFDDVAASRWSAGYIAFCVEQGIIDGMTATTYEPTGTLTGFQWAKMLLCAIGFGVKGEFTGSSWSVNTALVAHKVNLFAGDLDGADHTALRREQAVLYAFNALNTAKVAYSPNVTSYVYGIQGYTTVNNIGSTLAKDVYDLKYAQGIVVDVEGNGAGYTVVSKDYSTANVTNKIKADNDIDMMYHAARVWYTGTNTGVYTYDLAKTTTYKCQEIATGTKAATAANAKTGLYVGDKPAANAVSPVAYEAYLLDNSAVSAGSAYVTLYASFGNLGYVDAAKKTVTAGGYNVAAANVRTDISNIKYGAPVIVVYTTSTTENNAHGMYVYPVTATTGVVKSIAKENGVIVSVTLADGTVLKQSVLANNAGDREYYVIGNVYTFVLDSHGHVMYATKDHSRTLWVYTGEWRATGNYGDINTDQGKEYRFINVTSGEVAFYRIKGASSLVGGAYYDISATATAAGEYVANRVTKGQNTYAAGYIVDDFTIVQNSTSSSTYEYLAMPTDNRLTKGTVYFDGATVTFLVASGTGANMKVTPYTGIQAFKTAYNVATNGTMYLANTAMTVSSTTTGAWKADTIFVFETNLATTSRYVFIPNDIDKDDWSSVTGDPASYYVTYNGAYLEGKPISVSFYENQLSSGTFANGTLDRGFYVLTTNYVNGVPVYWLGERIDNTGNCYYQHVSLIDTGNATTHTWYLSNGAGRFEARDGEVTIVDVTNPTHKVETLYYLWQYMNAHPDWSLAFTVNPDTNRVDYIYLVNIGWDAEVTVSLSNELKAAGWVIHKIGTDVMPAGTTSKTYYDDDAHALVAYDIDVVIYNEKLKAERTTTTTYTLDVNKNKAAVVKTSYLTDGYIGLKIDVDSMVFGTKTQNFEIGGLVIGDVTVSLDNSDHVIYGTAGKNTQVFEDVVLGSELSFTFCQKTGNFNAEVGKQYWTGKYIDRANNQWNITGTLWNNNSVSCVTATILPKLDGTATIQSGAWVGIPNP